MKLTCPKSYQGGQTGDYQIKVTNRIPTPADQIDKELDKLFNTKLSVFLGYSFPLFCGIAWLCILLAIFS